MSAISANHSLVSDAFGSRCSARRVLGSAGVLGFQKKKKNRPRIALLLFGSDHGSSKRSEALPASPAANPSLAPCKQINDTHCAPSARAKSAGVPNYKTLGTARINKEGKYQIKNKGMKKKSCAGRKRSAGAPLTARAARH